MKGKLESGRSFKIISAKRHRHENHNALKMEIEALESIRKKVINSSSPLEKIVVGVTKKFPSPVLTGVNYNKCKELLVKVRKKI